MPSNYTSKLYNNEQTNLKDYALNCARSFGVFAEYRDQELPDSPIEIKVDQYYYDQVERDKEVSEYLKEATAEELTSYIIKKRVENAENKLNSSKEKNSIRERYLKMLEEVEAWEPPSDKHIEFKNFMNEQLENSIEFDCHEFIDLDELKKACGNAATDTVDVENYRSEMIRYHERLLRQSLEQLDEAERSAKEKTLWLKQFNESFEN